MSEKIVDIQTLVQDDHNFNKGTEAGRQLMERSFSELGAGRSILVDKDGRIIAGNKSQKAAIAAGIKKVRIIETTGDELVAVKRTDISLDSKEGRELALADNLTTQVNLEWDKVELQEVAAQQGIDLPDWGLDPQALGIDEQPAEPQEAQEDDFDEEKDKVETVCQKGDIWQLGQHRLMCGDSTSRDDFAKLMNGAKADLTFTSPPYNGDNSCGDGDIFQSKRNQRLYADGYSDDLSSSDYVKFASSVLGICFENTEGFVFWNVNYNSNSKFEYIQQIVPYLPMLIEQVVWKKSSAIPLKGCMRRAWEPVYIFSNTRKNLGTEAVETNIWEISNTHSQGISLVKPKTGIVLEPFGGTGTTIIAAEQLGRKCYTMELDPHYCDTIIARWEKFTGKKAIKL